MFKVGVQPIDRKRLIAIKEEEDERVLRRILKLGILHTQKRPYILRVLGSRLLDWMSSAPVAVWATSLLA